MKIITYPTALELYINFAFFVLYYLFSINVLKLFFCFLQDRPAFQRLLTLRVPGPPGKCSSAGPFPRARATLCSRLGPSLCPSPPRERPLCKCPRARARAVPRLGSRPSGIPRICPGRAKPGGGAVTWVQVPVRRVRGPRHFLQVPGLTRNQHKLLKQPFLLRAKTKRKKGYNPKVWEKETSNGVS